ncbi:MAG: hypothetical protein IJG23_07115 [Clostridia bacterium]|nr:hypothetical protein [Clostridia bacterium]
MGDYVFGNCRALTTVTLESGFNYSGLNISIGNYSAAVIGDIVTALKERTSSKPGMIVIGKNNIAKIADDTTITTALSNKNWVFA